LESPAAVSRLPATRPQKVVPAQVQTGSPAHSASLVVVCALIGKGIEEQVGQTVPAQMMATAFLGQTRACQDRHRGQLRRVSIVFDGYD